MSGNFEKIVVLIPTINESTLAEVIEAVISQIPPSQIYLLGCGASWM